MDQKVSDYITKQQSPQREICEVLRKIIFKNFPTVTEEMKLGVPYYEDKFYIVSLKDHVNFGFEIKNFSAEEIKNFAGNGRTVRVLEIKDIKEIDEKRVVKIIEKVLA